METETGGFTYRYVYGLEKVSVRISPVLTGAGDIVQNNAVKLWYHQDRLGSTDFLTDNVQGKVASYCDYDEWGAPIKKAVLKISARELDLVMEYTGHSYGQVLGGCIVLRLGCMTQWIGGLWRWIGLKGILSIHNRLYNTRIV